MKKSKKVKKLTVLNMYVIDMAINDCLTSTKTRMSSTRLKYTLKRVREYTDYLESRQKV